MHARCLCRPVKSTPRVEVIDAATQQRFDPTGTNKIRVAFTSDMDARWNRLKRMTLEAVKTRFTNAMTNVNAAALSGHSPLTAFQLWFDEALNQVVFGYNGSWTAKYIRSGSDKGEAHANNALLVKDAFDPNQPRDKDGQWTEAEGAPKIEKMRTDIESGDPKEFSSRMKWNADYDEVTISGGAVYPALRVIDRNTGKVAGVLVGRRGYAHGDVASDHGVDSELVMGGLRHREGSIDYERGFVQRKKYYRAEDVDLDTAVLAPHSKYAVKDAVDDRTTLLQSLTVSELQGVMEAVSQQAVRAYANGLLTNASAPYLAQSINSAIDKVGKVRSHSLIQFMVVRAHALATIAVFRAANVPSVGTVAESVRSSSPSLGGLTLDARRKAKVRKDLVEVITAGDHKVCPICEEISESGPYTLDEAERLLPAHPNCRCAFVPWHDARFANVHSEDAKWNEEDHPRDKLGKFTDDDLKKQHEDYQSQMKSKDISTQKFYSLARKRDEIYNEIKRRSESKSSSKISQAVIDPKVGAAKAIYNSVEKGDESSSSAVEKFSQEQKKVYKDLASSSSLSKKETDALKTYTSDKGYKEINTALRSGKSHPLVNDLDKVASSVKLEKDIVAYRGLLYGDGYKAGKPFTEKSYMSLSMDYDTARSFSTGHADELAGSVVEFLIPAGTKIGFGKKSESEIILPRNTSGEIDAKKYVMQSGQSTILTGRLKKRAVHDSFDPNQPRDDEGKWVTAWHGTTTDKIDSILKNGLLTSKATDDYRGKVVYVTESKSEAIRHASERLGLEEGSGEQAVALELKIPQDEFLKFKHDKEQKGATFTINDIPRKWIKKIHVSSVDAFDPNQPRDKDGKWSASAAAEAVIEDYQKDPVAGVGIQFFTHPKDSSYSDDAKRTVYLIWINRSKDAAKGSGAQAIDKLTKLADKHSVTLNLNVDPSSKKFLLNYYSKFGFERYKKTTEMIRKPKKPVNDAFDPNEPRDKNGQWTKAGGEGGNEPDITVYHGTTRVLLQSIKKHGLVPSALQEEIIGKNALGSDAWAEKYGMDIQRFNIGDRALSVYITPNPRTAADFASYASEVNNSEPVILKLKIPKEKAKDIFVDELSGEVMDAYRFKGHVTPDMIDNVAFTKRGKVELSSITDAAGDIVLYAVIFVDGKNAEEES